MDEKLYGYMNWPRIEAIVYGEEASPRDVDGAKDYSGWCSESRDFFRTQKR